ncbi:hypothetical protein MesoLj113c_56010 [Mesorhizobium sp. 113-3-9]|nr:hypothetical protein MesoLj113c_56010 [Mesorhizobium sp. 113-3-9]
MIPFVGIKKNSKFAPYALNISKFSTSNLLLPIYKAYKEYENKKETNIIGDTLYKIYFRVVELLIISTKNNIADPTANIIKVYPSINTATKVAPKNKMDEGKRQFSRINRNWA